MDSVTVPNSFKAKSGRFFAAVIRLIVVLPVLLLAVATLSHGQAISSNGGSIQGTITDSTGAVVANAAVVVTAPDTGQSRTVTTDSAGFYSVGPLNPGDYTVSISVPGFMSLSVKTVVKTGTVTSGSFKLTVGSSNTTVEVVASALQVNTDQMGVADTITREQIETLPINGRNFLDAEQLQPGVILQSGLTFDPTKAGYSAISLDGVAGRTTRILLDGQDITDETVGTTIMNVPTGAIDESQLNRSTQDVSGEVTSTGQVLASTRSGTNAFHGQLFYNFQDYRVGFAAVTGGYNAPFQRNQFGGEVGGPIIKDKLFFFVDSERVKQDAEASATTSPTFAAVQAKYPTIPEPFRDTFSIGRLDYNAPHGYHLFVRAAYDDNSSFSNFSDLYSLYQSRNNVPAFVGGADFITGKFTHSIRGGYEKFHNLLGDGTAGLTSIYNPSVSDRSAGHLDRRRGRLLRRPELPGAAGHLPIRQADSLRRHLDSRSTQRQVRRELQPDPGRRIRRILRSVAVHRFLRRRTVLDPVGHLPIRSTTIRRSITFWVTATAYSLRSPASGSPAAAPSTIALRSMAQTRGR